MLESVEIPEHLIIVIENQETVAHDVNIQPGGVPLRAWGEDLLRSHAHYGIAVGQQNGVMVHTRQASGSDGGRKRDRATHAEVGGTLSNELLLQNADVGLANNVAAKIDLA